MEFLAVHGPLRQLDHFGRHLNFFQYYLIDVFAFVVSLGVLSLVALLFVSYYILRAGLSVLSGIVVIKRKHD